MPCLGRQNCRVAMVEVVNVIMVGVMVVKGGGW